MEFRGNLSLDIKDGNVREAWLYGGERRVLSYATEWIPNVDDRAVIASRRNRGNDARACE